MLRNNKQNHQIINENAVNLIAKLERIRLLIQEVNLLHSQGLMHGNIIAIHRSGAGSRDLGINVNRIAKNVISKPAFSIPVEINENLLKFVRLPVQDASDDLDPAIYPDESLGQQFGIKTDIYMFASLVQDLLKDHQKVHSSLRVMLNRMHALYHDRPSSLDVLLYFNYLHVYHAEPHDSKERIRLSAMMHVISQGLLAELNTYTLSHRQAINIQGLMQENLLIPGVISLLKKHEEIDVSLSWLANLGILNAPLLRSLMNDDSLCAKLPLFHHTKQGFINDVFANMADKLSIKELKHLLTMQRELNLPIGLKFLTKLNEKMSLADKREVAFTAIRLSLQLVRTEKEYNALYQSLIAMKDDKALGYLYARQGWMTTLSIHSHRWQGQRVSETWLNVMNLFTQAKRSIPLEEKPRVGMMGVIN